MKKVGGATLLQKEHFEMKNPAGKPVVGWRSTSDGERGFFNPIGFSMIWLVVQKIVEAVMAPLYEQPMIIESPGAVVIAIFQGKVAMVKNLRNTGERLRYSAGKFQNYIQFLEETNSWAELADSLGQEMWELPAGLAPNDDGGNLEQIVLKAARLEAKQEAGIKIINPEIIGKINFNPTFFAHSQYVVSGEVASVGDNSPELEELISEIQFFSPAEIRELIDAGKLQDGRTLAALQLARIHI
ncbi:MAG: hypothetical protein R3B41_00095 [Candidatus Doudnabacteria bacterium]